MVLKKEEHIHFACHCAKKQPSSFVYYNNPKKMAWRALDTALQINGKCVKYIFFFVFA